MARIRYVDFPPKAIEMDPNYVSNRLVVLSMKRSGRANPSLNISVKIKSQKYKRMTELYMHAARPESLYNIHMLPFFINSSRIIIS